MTSDTTLFIAFIGGIVAFLSPCVLPIIPGFLAYLAGESIGSDQKPNRLPIFINSVFFVLGFSVIFALIGVLLNTLLEAVAYDAQLWLARIGGAIVILFGLYLVGLWKPKFLQQEHKIQVKQHKSRYLTSFLFGAAFAAGWTPCVGAVLGAILALAATQPGAAFSLLLAFALGLGVPFLIVGAFAAEATIWIHKYGKVAKVINVIFGIALIALGILIFTNNLARLANFEILNNYLLEGEL